jgi:hypothetical protein
MNIFITNWTFIISTVSENSEMKDIKLFSQEIKQYLEKKKKPSEYSQPYTDIFSPPIHEQP